MDIANNLGSFAAGGGFVALLAVVIRLLFAREKSEYARLDTRIQVLEKALQAEQAGHLKCAEEVGVLRGRVEQLTIDMNQVVSRHSMNNKLHEERLAFDLATLKLNAEVNVQQTGDAG